jgi:hypothetical protein
MSGPFGVNMTLIGGGKSSGEIVVAAATFLSMNFLSIRVVALEGKIRREFLMALEVFGEREHLDYQTRPDEFVRRLVKPTYRTDTHGLFWLALDKQGTFLAKAIFRAQGVSRDQSVYRSVRKLNQIESTIAPPPGEPVLLRVWEEAKQRAFRLSIDHHKQKVEQGYRSYMDSRAPLTPEQSRYYVWFESLYEVLIPWQDVIRNIQSDYS